MQKTETFESISIIYILNCVSLKCHVCISVIFFFILFLFSSLMFSMSDAVKSWREFGLHQFSIAKVPDSSREGLLAGHLSRQALL